MIEKGYGPVIDKLCIIQLIEADLQLLMRIFIELKCKKYLEKDKRLSKANYSSWKNYSIEMAILEKQLICNSYLLQLTLVIHNLIDSQSYCNR